MREDPVASHAGVRSTAPNEPFLALYRDRYTRMVRLATLLVDHVDLAEEVVQDAFVAVYQRWGSLEDPAGYLRTCVVNRCHDMRRRRRLSRTRDHLAAAEPSTIEPDHLRDAIRRLPPDQRAAIVLRFYEDLTIPQVAETMGARQGTVKSWLHRALAELREVIDRDG
jgi:RNA polymerase sigma-70 factor (sigma-E family)